VDLEVDGSRDGRDGGPGRRAGPVGTDDAGRPCTYRLEEITEHEGWAALDALPPARRDPPSPAHTLRRLWCNDQLLDLRWYGPSTPDGATVAAEIARALDRLSVAPGGIGVRPDAAGVVAVPAYFWVDGAATAPTETVVLPGFGTTLTVLAELTAVTWDFGDGTPPVVGDLGRPWPARSSVHHVYAEDGAVTVTATLRYQPRFTLDGAPGTPLAPFTVTATRTYEVQQVQAVRTR
jgi:hypothetical protein